MKKVVVTQRMVFEGTYEIEIPNADYDILTDGDPGNFDRIDVETDILEKIFYLMRDDIQRWKSGVWDAIRYDSDYQIETKNGDVIVEFS